MFNWNGHVLKFPRTQISTALKRPEASQVGVYVLIGYQDDVETVYIGESDDVGARIRNHDLNKDWWTEAAVITTQSNTLHKAHVRYLESRLIGQAKKAGVVALANSTVGSATPLPEAAKASMEAFLDYVFAILPAVRLDCFLENTRPAKVATESVNSSDDPETQFELKTPKNKVSGRARFADGELIVLAGSTARRNWEGTPSHTYAELFSDLVKAGVLVEAGDMRVFSKDYAFKSASAAGAVLNGRATNGQEAWKLIGKGITYRQWESDRLGSEAG
ncbi:hypothetical protein MMB232_01412 [Brevundimonas subvibrioides]